MKKDEKKIVSYEDKDIALDSLEIGTAAISALVGVVIGGPVGAVVGAVATPTLSMAHNIVARAKERRRIRLEKIVKSSIKTSGKSIEDAFNELLSNENKADDLFSILTLAVSSDNSLDGIFSGLISELLLSNSDTQKDRVLIVGDAVRNFRSIHLKIICELYSAGGVLTATEISNLVNVPEIELRSVVRELELRGIILDLGKIPIEWKLRELGHAIATLIYNQKEKNNVLSK